MANKLFNTSDISAIASAIRAKNGSSDTYKVSEMASAIADIPSGSSEWEIEFFDYLTLNDDGNCEVKGTITADYSYELFFNNIRTQANTIHPFLRTKLTDWTYWVSIYLSGLRYYFGNNNGASVGGEGLGYSSIQGEHVVKYDSSTSKITIDNGTIGTPQSYTSSASEGTVDMFILGGSVGSSNYFYGQIEEFKIWNNSDVLIHDYIPAAIKHNGEVVSNGLYDTIENAFYYAYKGIATNTKLTP